MAIDKTNKQSRNNQSGKLNRGEKIESICFEKSIVTYFKFRFTACYAAEQRSLNEHKQNIVCPHNMGGDLNE
jgi:hypothetical protein